MSEHTKIENRADGSKSTVERLVICLRYGFRFKPMLRCWWRETKTLGTLAWFVPVSVFALVAQLLLVAIYPINHFIYQPVKLALCGDSGFVNALERTLRNR